MEEVSREFCNVTNPSAPYGSVPTGSGLKLLKIVHLTVLNPSKAKLIRDLFLEICERDHLLITGPSGSGKTSLLRPTAGLWSFGRGTITFYDRNMRDSLRAFPQMWLLLE
ncbi:ABC transporter D family member 2, chloroplastic [Sesamum alatum]|uniref:ABC transporter D family member 2, chloroplastic n=1 Tax=Sesamum alatum TaxID=300844 RepID=A0AAE1Z193_9LAMI|nr:ABC transporter D family member 2, chloroplastic [Sesamum alatum]